MSRTRAGFTIVEMLVVISIISILMGILLPAIGRARDTARLIISQTNLHQLGRAHHVYAAEWNDRQFTLTNDSLSRYGNTPSSALSGYRSANNQFHTGILLGWADAAGVPGLWGFYFDNPLNHNLVQPIDFNTGFGWFRMPNARQFSQYLNGRFYDPIFYAPKDRLVWSALEPALDSPHEYVPSDVLGNFVWSSYCLSAAALYSPGRVRSQGIPGSLDARRRLPRTVDESTPPSRPQEPDARASLAAAAPLRVQRLHGRRHLRRV